MQVPKITKKWLMVVALAVFVVTSLGAIIVNSFLMGHGWNLNYSISRYVGSETWSALVFAAGNIVVALAMIYYFDNVARIWKLPRVFNWLMVLMAMALLGLSACPVGYFDLPGTHYASSSPSAIHEICSRAMFLAMLCTTAIVALCDRASRTTRILAILYIVYGVICVAAYLLRASWFLNAMLIFESLYLLGFMVFCLAYWSRGKTIEQKKVKR